MAMRSSFVGQGSVGRAAGAAAGFTASLLAAACGLDGQGALPASAASTSAGGGTSTGGASTSGSGGATTSSSGTGVTILPYSHRRRIRVSAPAVSLPSDYSISVVIDHMSLVGAGRSRPDGDDVRIYRDEGGQRVELDRRLDPASSWATPKTMLWFRTTLPVAAASEDASYWLYYGDQAAADPPSDGNRVYAIWTDFDAPPGPDWTLSLVGSATGSTSQSGSALELQVASDDVWDTADDFAFLHHAISGDFVADTRVLSMGGTLDGWSTMGGVMLRQSLVPGSRHHMMSPVHSSAARTNRYRLMNGDNTSEYTQGNDDSTPEYEGLTRLGNSSRAFSSPDGLIWQEVGSEVTFAQPLADPVLVGIPACNLSASKGTVTVDWFRVRKLVSPGPDVVVGPEEQGPF